MQVFFVGGPPKSGTTWVQRALDLHPDVTCSGEGHFHEFIVRPMISMYRTHNERLGIIGKVVYEGDPLYRVTSEHEMILSIRQTILSIMHRRAKPEITAIGDKTPDNAKALRDFNILFPEMRYVSVFRDPRDVAVSRLHHGLRIRNRSDFDFKDDLYDEIIRETIRVWNLYFEKTQAFATDHPEKVHQILYEDFLRDAPVQLKQLFMFLRLHTTDERIKEIAFLSSFEAMTGRRSGQEDRRSFLRKGIQGDWANVLNKHASAAITQACNKGMIALGYL